MRLVGTARGPGRSSRSTSAPASASSMHAYGDGPDAGELDDLDSLRAVRARRLLASIVARRDLDAASAGHATVLYGGVGDPGATARARERAGPRHACSASTPTTTTAAPLARRDVAAHRRSVADARRDAASLEVASTALGTARCPLDAPARARRSSLLAAALARAAGVTGARLDVDGRPARRGRAVVVGRLRRRRRARARRRTATPSRSRGACQAAERAAGSDVGLLDQLVVLVARDGARRRPRLRGPVVRDVRRCPTAIGLSVVDTGERRLGRGHRLRRPARASAPAAAASSATARSATSSSDLERLDDAVLRRRARHVVTECARVRAARVALAHGRPRRRFGATPRRGRTRACATTSRSRRRASRPRATTLGRSVGVVGVAAHRRGLRRLPARRARPGAHVDARRPVVDPPRLGSGRRVGQLVELSATTRSSTRAAAPLVEALVGEREALVERVAPVGGDERRGGVQHHDVAHRRRPRPRGRSRAIAALRRGVAAADRLDAATPRCRGTSGRATTRASVTSPAASLVTSTTRVRAGRVDLVEAVLAADDERVPRAALRDDGRHRVEQHRIRDAEQQVADLRGVRHRAEEVEDRPDPERRADRRDRRERRVERRCEAEAEARLHDARATTTSGPGAIVTPSASSRSAAPTCERRPAAPVLDHRDARARDDERGHRRHVHRARAVAPGADDVDGAVGACPRASSRGTASAVIASSSPTSSSAVGPLAASATRKPATCSGAHRPVEDLAQRRGGAVRADASAPRRARRSRRRATQAPRVSPTTGRGRGRRVR